MSKISKKTKKTAISKYISLSNCVAGVMNPDSFRPHIFYKKRNLSKEEKYVRRVQISLIHAL